jgi:hypothetical protein
MKLHYENRDKVIDKKKTIMLSNEEIFLIEKHAKQANKTFGGFVRDAISEYIRNRMRQTSIFGDNDKPPLI